MRRRIGVAAFLGSGFGCSASTLLTAPPPRSLLSVRRSSSFPAWAEHKSEKFLILGPFLATPREISLRHRAPGVCKAAAIVCASGYSSLVLLLNLMLQGSQPCCTAASADRMKALAIPNPGALSCACFRLLPVVAGPEVHEVQTWRPSLHCATCPIQHALLLPPTRFLLRNFDFRFQERGKRKLDPLGNLLNQQQPLLPPSTPDLGSPFQVRLVWGHLFKCGT